MTGKDRLILGAIFLGLLLVVLVLDLADLFCYVRDKVVARARRLVRAIRRRKSL